MTEPDFDIWLHGFAAHTREAPQLALCRVFGIPQPAAEALLATLPRVVKRDASPAQAERIVQALEAIGGQAEAVPTRVVPAPVLVVGTQPVEAKAATIVRHAPRSGELPELKEHELLPSTVTSATLQLGTQELEAFFAVPAAAEAKPFAEPVRTGDPHDTLVEPPPPWADPELPPQTAATPQWLDLSLAPPMRVSVRAPGYPESARPPSTTAAMGAPRMLDALDLGSADERIQTPSGTPTAMSEPAPDVLSEKPKAASLKITRNVHEWMKSTEDLPAISLAPPSSRPPPNIGPQPPSQSPTSWQNPMALPASHAPPANLGMRPASERGRTARLRSQHPPSMRPSSSLKPTGPSLGDAFLMVLRGEGRVAVRSYPTLGFAIILAATTMLFLVAYAAF